MDVELSVAFDMGRYSQAKARWESAVDVVFELAAIGGSPKGRLMVRAGRVSHHLARPLSCWVARRKLCA